MSITKDQKDQNLKFFENLNDVVDDFNVAEEDDHNALVVIGLTQREPASEGGPDGKSLLLAKGSEVSVVAALVNAMKTDADFKRLFEAALEEVNEDEELNGENDTESGLSNNQEVANEIIKDLENGFDVTNTKDCYMLIGKSDGQLFAAMNGGGVELAEAVALGMAREKGFEAIISASHSAFPEGVKHFGEDYISNIRKEMSVGEITKSK